MPTDESLLWQIRAFIYKHFADTTRPPSVAETAQHFGIPADQAAGLYRELHERHALFLEPESTTVRMANPFSALPTDFKVHANGKTYFANCAWDMLGIPAALGCDADMQAICAESGQPLALEVRAGKVTDSEARVHFPLPFARWYDDLVYT